MALTGKKRLFADAVLAGNSNTEAAILAGYSAKTAPQSGSRMGNKDAEIAAYLAEHQGAVAPVSAERAVPKGNEPPGGVQEKHYTDPADLLMDQMNDSTLDPRDRRDAAKALMPFRHQKLGEGGKKEELEEKAKKAGQGRFKAAPTPLKLVGGH